MRVTFFRRQGFGPHLKTAQTDTLALAVQQTAGFVKQLCLQRIQRLRAVTVGPPEQGILNRETRFEVDASVFAETGSAVIRPGTQGIGAEGGFLRGESHPVRSRQCHAHMGRGRLQQLCLAADAQADEGAIRFMLLMKGSLRNACRAAGQQRHRPAEAGVRQAGTPIPAEHAGGLAQVRIAGQRIRGRADGADAVRFGNKARWRTEQHRDAAFPAALRRSDIELPWTVHVVALACGLPVDGDLRKGVDAFKAQDEPAAGALLRRQADCGFIAEVAVHQAQRVCFVVPPEGVGHQTLLQQGAVNGRGNAGLDRRLRDAVRVVSQDSERPVFCQVSLDHSILSKKNSAPQDGVSLCMGISGCPCRRGCPLPLVRQNLRRRARARSGR